MLYINHPEALVAIAEERRNGLGMRLASGTDPMPEGAEARRASRPRSVHNGFPEIASPGYATP